MSFRCVTAVVAILGLASTSCQVITESMPVSVTPLDVPTSAPVHTKAPRPTETVPPAGLPAPKRTKTPAPGDPNGTPTNVPGCPGSWPPSCQPAASVSVVTFWILCGSEVVPNSKFATSAPANCTVKLDATPKDASGIPTQTSDPAWTFGMSNPAYYVSWGGGAFNPTLHAEGIPGTFTAYCVVGSARSNDLVFYFQ